MKNVFKGTRFAVVFSAMATLRTFFMQFLSTGYRLAASFDWLLPVVGLRVNRMRAIAAIMFSLVFAVPLVAQEATLPAVIVAPAEMSGLGDTARFSGRLVASQKVELRARVSGFIQSIDFVEGATVKMGDRLYTIESQAYEAVVQEVEGAIKAAEAQLSLAEIERTRKQQLVDRQAVAQSELDIAVANVGKAEGEVLRLQGELDRASLDVSYTDIAAPFDGVMGLSIFDVGAFVGPESGALTTLTRLDPMTVEFPIPSTVYINFRQSQARGEATGAANISLLLPNGSEYSELGKLDFIDAEVARGTDTVIVRAVFDNPDGLLLDGALVTVQLLSEDPEIVLNVPQQAIQRDQAGDFVMVVDQQSMVEQRRVSVARTSEGRSVISEGLQEGELIIIEGINKVRPGIEVDAATKADG